MPEECLVQSQRSDRECARDALMRDQISQSVAESIVRAVLYAAPALLCACAASVSDPDLWWHLRSGEWIVQHRAIPHADHFSSTVAGKPWAAYSWLFEVFVLQLFQRLGLTGVVMYTTGMVLAITVALHRLIKGLQSDFTVAVLLTFTAALSLWRLNSPRPWHFTILFFVLELDILLQARRTGRARELLLLPLIFALWTNLHIQFIDGLLILALASAESIAAVWWPAARSRLQLASILFTFAACALATLCNPYGWHIYQVAHALAAQPGVVDHLAELQAIPFRNVSDYCVLLLALGAAASLARSSRVRVFETAAFVLAVFLSFRSQRDVWIIAAVASAIIASSIGSRDTSPGQDPQGRSMFMWPVTMVAICLLLFTGFRSLHINNPGLENRLENNLPVRAVAFVRANDYRGPLFNDYPWGGYLIWSLRQPVSIDGRAALYGDQRLDRAAATWAGAPGWNTDTGLLQSRLVIGPVKSPLTQLLRSDPRFQLAYEDPLAAVFVRR